MEIPALRVGIALGAGCCSSSPEFIWGINRAARPVQRNLCLTSMETHILLSLSVLIGLTVHFTFCAVSAHVTRRNESVVNGFVAEKASTTEKDKNEYKPKVIIPNTLARWPWPRRINPHHAVVIKESEAWTVSLSAFSPKAQHAFNRCKFGKEFHPLSLTHVLTLFGRSLCLHGLSNSKER